MTQDAAIWGRSLWSDLAGPGPDLPALEGDASADVAIVGAGFLGLSTALHLAERGVAVTLVDAEEPGFGASGRNTGFVVPALRAKLGSDEVARRLGAERAARLVDLVDRSGETLFDLVRQRAIACAAEPTGWLQPVHSEAMARLIEARAGEAAGRGRPVRYLSATETAERTGTRGYRGALFDASGGQLNPLAYARGLTRTCLDRGVRVAVRSRVSAVTREGRGWRLATKGGSILADRVVLATNGMVGSLMPDLAASIVPVVIHQIATDPLGANAGDILPGRSPLSDTRRHTFAVRRSPDDRLVTGGIVPVGPGAFARAARRFTRRLTAFFPASARFRAAYVWRGVIAQTIDSLPRLYNLGPGLDAVIGCNGRGVALTTALGRETARLLSGEIGPGDFPLPVVATAPIPGHGLARLGPSLWLPWSSLRDWIDAR